MQVAKVAEKLDADVLKQFVVGVQKVIEALLIEQEHVGSQPGPVPVDYNTAGLPRAEPPGGWIGTGELRAASQKMSEAIAAEKWVEGFVFAVQAMGTLRP